jgi:hypothetical protein
MPLIMVGIEKHVQFRESVEVKKQEDSYQTSVLYREQK